MVLACLVLKCSWVGLAQLVFCQLEFACLDRGCRVLSCHPSLSEPTSVFCTNPISLPPVRSGQSPPIPRTTPPRHAHVPKVPEGLAAGNPDRNRPSEQRIPTRSPATCPPPHRRPLGPRGRGRGAARRNPETIRLLGPPLVRRRGWGRERGRLRQGDGAAGSGAGGTTGTCPRSL